MNCPKCDGKTAVKDSCALADVVYRKRRCIECGYTFTTDEYLCEIDEPIHVLRYQKQKRRKQNERTE